MQPIFRVVVNRTEERRIASPQDVDCLCSDLFRLPVFIVQVITQGGEQHRTLDVVVGTGRAIVDFLDLGLGIKLCSRDETCSQRGFVSLKNDAYAALELDQIEVHYRDLISPMRAVSILRHYLNTGEPTDLVRWPSDDWAEWGDSEVIPDLPSPPADDIPF